jgi:hypothetical protein
MAVRRLAPRFIWRRPGSNRQPPACKTGALPIELRPRYFPMGVLGFEPRTSALSELRSSQLSYTPGSSCGQIKKPNHIGFGPTRPGFGIERHPPSRLPVIRIVMNKIPARKMAPLPEVFRRKRIIRWAEKESTGKKEERGEAMTEAEYWRKLEEIGWMDHSDRQSASDVLQSLRGKNPKRGR